MDQAPDLSLTLPRDAYYVLVDTLNRSLPPPSTDTADACARRNHAAIAKAASLLPITAAEAELAGQFVAAAAQASECLVEARHYRADITVALKCSAQAACMMRQAQGALRSLLALQATRRKLQADAAGADAAAWAEHCATGFMMHALTGEPLAVAPEPPPPPPAPPEPAPPADAEPTPDPAAEADLYVAMYPERATLIRRLGHVPDDARFGPPDDWLVHALVTGTSPALLALDRGAG